MSSLVFRQICNAILQVTVNLHVNKLDRIENLIGIMEVKDWQLFHPFKNGDRPKKELFDELVSYAFGRQLPNNRKYGAKPSGN